LASAAAITLPRWSIATPVVACAVLALAWGRELGWPMLVLITVCLFAAVIAAVLHAEVVAHRVGEPFGTLTLAVAVTVIEVALIVSLMLSGGEATSALPRDTVFAAVMIICNGIVGLCLLIGAIRHRVLEFRVDGTSPALAVLAALTTLTLVLPTTTVTTPGPTFSPAQLAFAGVMSLTLYGVFVFVQTVRHRDYFVSVGATDESSPANPPSSANALASLGLLVLALIAVVGLAKTLAPAIEAGVRAAHAPATSVGVAIAMLVLLPEAWAAVRAAAANQMQTSLNLALGSGLATIGLTIPTVAALSLWIELPLTLGLPPKDVVLLMLTLFVAVLTLGSGRATVLQAAVHMVLFAVFLFLAVVP
jgi:Ca2+:H+ antiporter